MQIGEAPRSDRHVQVVANVAWQSSFYRQRADIYLPRAGRRGTIIWLHGGGFFIAERDQVAGVIRALARRGWVGMNIDYRLTRPRDLTYSKGRAGITDASRDAERALNWANAQGLPRPYFLAGYSSGAVAALVAARNDDEVVGVVGFSSPLPLRKNDRRGPPVLMIHGAVDDIRSGDDVLRECYQTRSSGGFCEFKQMLASHDIFGERFAPVVNYVWGWLETHRSVQTRSCPNQQFCSDSLLGSAGGLGRRSP